MSLDIKFGNKDILFVYKGDKLVYPNPIKDGLLLWYDFRGIKNLDTNKEVAKDLSGNNNDGQLQNFNFTSQSGYDKNKLLFDGVDDELHIPELNLDETGMTVGVDGNIYSYEDDKTLSVGEDGEVVEGRNYALDSEEYYRAPRNKGEAEDNYQFSTLYLSDVIHGKVTVSGFLNLEEGKTDTATVLFRDENGTVMRGDAGLSNNDYFHITVEIPISRPVILIYIYFGQSGNTRGNGGYLRNIKFEKGPQATPYSPAPEDYKTTILSPSSMSDLKLYDRPLRKDELLQNTESEGLKELKDGVVVQDGLIMHYDFSKESNNSEYKGKAFDYSGNGNHGTLQNFNYTAESGYVDDGLKFDGVDDYISIGNIAKPLIINDSPEYALEMTIKVNENKRNNLFYSAEIIKLDIHGNRIRNTGAGSTASVNYDFLNKRKHIVYMVSKKQIIFYVDGVEIYNREASSPENLPNLEISYLGFYVPEGRPNIDLNSARIYNRPLSAEEIQHNYEIEKEKFNLE